VLISIVYAFRNRDSNRVKASLLSLSEQSQQNFEVLFVDYGSEESYSLSVKEVVEQFPFTCYHYIAHQGLLWNKSKALNYGIKQAKGEYVFIADVDIVFHPDTTKMFELICNPDIAYLFQLSYLSKPESDKLLKVIDFDSLSVSHKGTVNGMVLVDIEALRKVHGLDEFFHFYGAEDVDLFQRLECLGLKIIQREELYFKHQWHEIYSSHDDSKLSLVPRLYNINRINHQHYFFNTKQKLTVPLNQTNWGAVLSSESKKILDTPDIIIELSNIHSDILHFFEVELRSYKNKVIRIVICEDPNYKSKKTKLKLLLKKQIPPYMTMKQINDIILSKIVYQYRDNNYFYEISEDYKRITFTIQFN
jgi:glycosyltransferase involved in cell wall biosynthesis